MATKIKMPVATMTPAATTTSKPSKALDFTQRSYLQHALIPCARDFVDAILKDGNLLSPLLAEGFIDDGALKQFLVYLEMLPEWMLNLYDRQLFVVDDDLPEWHGAQADTETPDGVPIVIAVRLRSSMLDPFDNKTIQSRVRTLLHEVSHTLVIDRAFPILDYSYAPGWGFRYLGALCAENADTFAEAVMIPAEDPSFEHIENGLTGFPGLFRTVGLSTLQHSELLNVGELGLCAALAWADLRINRGWLRMHDYNEFAKATDNGSPDFAELRKIEAQFVTLRLIDKRPNDPVDRLFRTKRLLDGTDRDTVKVLYEGLGQMKSWIANARIVIVLAGAGVKFDPESGRLQIPLDQLSSSTSVLGNQILDQLFASILGLSIKQADLFNICIVNDRQREREKMGDIWTNLLKITGTQNKHINGMNTLNARLAAVAAEEKANYWNRAGTMMAMPRRTKLFQDKAKDPSKTVSEVDSTFEIINELDAAIANIIGDEELNVQLTNRRAKALNIMKAGMARLTTLATAEMEASKKAAEAQGWKDLAVKIAAQK